MLLSFSNFEKYIFYKLFIEIVHLSQFLPLCSMLLFTSITQSIFVNIAAFTVWRIIKEGSKSGVNSEKYPNSKGNGVEKYWVRILKEEKKRQMSQGHDFDKI